MDLTTEEHTARMVSVLVDKSATIGDKLGAIEAIINSRKFKYLQKLIAAGADVNNDVNIAAEALYVACERGDGELVQFLLGAGADVNARVKQKDTTLIQTVGNGHSECVELLIKAGADVNKTDSLQLVSPLSVASKTGQNNLVALLVESGADVNWANCHGWTPLLRAAEKGHCVCVDLLIREGANVNANTVFGDTALIVSAEQGFTECVDSLLKAGVDVNMSASRGRLALSGAVYSNNDHIVRLMINAGADVNLVAHRTAYSPLMIAAEGGNSKSVELLLQAGANVNQVAFNGKTALNCSVWKIGNNPCTRLLIEAGADVNAAGKDGNTCLITAAFHENLPIVKLLLYKGAIINEVNIRGLSAIHFCLNKRPQEQNEDILTLLFVAGETIDRNRIPESADHLRQLLKPSLDLKHICRMAIRNYLMHLDPQTHLFRRVLKTGLPASLCAYLLYFLTLDECN